MQPAVSLPRGYPMRAVTLALFFMLCLCADPLASSHAAPHFENSGKTIHADAQRFHASLEKMAGQMIMVGFRGTGEDPLSAELHTLLADIRKGRIGGLVLFDRDLANAQAKRNIVSLEQAKQLIAGLQAAAPVPLFIAVDQEGGRVRRFKEEHGVAYTPSAQELGRKTPAETFNEAFRLGEALHSVGVNLNFAPSLDVNINPQSPVIGALGRSFSADPEQVAAHGRAFARGLGRAGILACYKHFPGHGSATNDSHLAYTDISTTWQKKELEPYRMLLSSQAPAMVMVGHVTLRQKSGTLPASLSRTLINGVLRRDLGWKGIVITDDLQMQAIAGQHTTKETIKLAVQAGVDILLFGNNIRYDPEEGSKIHAILMELVRDGQISPKRIRESYTRIMKVKAGLGK